MLLTITTTYQPATDLGYLLHKHPARVQKFHLPFGEGHVFFPEATPEKCTAALILEIDSIKLIRGKNDFSLSQYVNDRPYSASSFMSVAIAKIFGTALNGTSKDRPELVKQEIPLSAHLSVISSDGGEELLQNLFAPLGYSLDIQSYELDPQFPEWGESQSYSLTLENTVRLSDLLSHLYVLIPTLDDQKHYFVSDEEVDKLVRHGEGWLQQHPYRDMIIRRYLKHQYSLNQLALERLIDEDVEAQDENSQEEYLEEKVNLHTIRLNTVLDEILKSGAKSVVDLGCGEGKLLKLLVQEGTIDNILGMDVSSRELERAERILNFERMPERQREKIKIIQGSLLYRDHRLNGFDAAAVVEVIEHLDPPRLAAFERVVFKYAQPTTIIVTTPNAEYNVVWETLPAGEFRHTDHRFEWTRAEFQNWAAQIADEYGYGVEFIPIGDEMENVGAPGQAAIFKKLENQEISNGN